MNNSFAFSLYVPGDTLIHRADPRSKLIAVMLLVVSLFSTTRWPSILAALALTLILILLGRIPLSYIGRALRPVSFIIVFTLLVNSVSLHPLAFLPQGFMRGLLFSTRLVEVMLLSTLVTLTTSPVALTDGMTLLMRPLASLRVPVDDIAMMLSIALRFIPTIAAEAQTIIRAQTARGARFYEGSLIVRLRAWTVVVVPLLIQLFRRADTLALAMEARCYTGRGRTHLRELRLHSGDWLAMALAFVIAVAFIVFR
jgi:energy-coupling factor transport system permease protein